MKEKKKDYSTLANVFLVLAILIGISGMWEFALIFIFLSFVINGKNVSYLSKKIELKESRVRLLFSTGGLILFGYFAFSPSSILEQAGAGFIGFVVALIFFIINLIKYLRERKK